MVHIESATFSNKVKRMVWGLGLDSWSNIMVALLVVAGFFGLCAAVSTFVVVKLQKQEAGDQAERVEELRASNLKLEIRIAPRSLLGASATEFTQALSPVVRGLAIDVISYEGMGTDVALLSQQIAGVLNAAGATATVLTPMGAGVVVQGIVVRSAADAPANEKAAIGPIVNALHQAGLEAGPWAEYPANEAPAGGYMGPPGHPLAKLRILVGAKS